MASIFILKVLAIVVFPSLSAVLTDECEKHLDTKWMDEGSGEGIFQFEHKKKSHEHTQPVLRSVVECGAVNFERDFRGSGRSFIRDYRTFTPYP